LVIVVDIVLILEKLMNLVGWLYFMHLNAVLDWFVGCWYWKQMGKLLIRLVW